MGRKAFRLFLALVFFSDIPTRITTQPVHLGISPPSSRVIFVASRFHAACHDHTVQLRREIFRPSLRYIRYDMSDGIILLCYKALPVQIEF
ncbi:hypothetical protein BD769DRAFT_1430677 [Suillus cothurnatus]|nr:hypothetical protein BD769DRAFT_1430677 [Suillus cothurnatus]